jgi:hypothetical protein
METSPPTMSFKRDLIGPRLASWEELLIRLASVQLIQGSDEFCWGLTKNGVFSVDSTYKALIEPVQPVIHNNAIWKKNIPLKTKVAWYFRHGVILTNKNLARRNWHDCMKCVFCHEDETIK